MITLDTLLWGEGIDGWPIGFCSALLGRQVLDQLAELEAQLNGLKAEKVGHWRWLKRLRVNRESPAKNEGEVADFLAKIYVSYLIC